MKFSIKSDVGRGNAAANLIRGQEVNHVQLDPRHRGCKKQIISIQIQKIESVFCVNFNKNQLKLVIHSILPLGL
ncbi:MAG TPA: hypothetical protein D7H79_04345 [Candidatus Poseidoniales archaeon]|nr:MAG TPA: hypothetical protein D7H79_04345 [Candidatus Poseidoniales archaeon]